MDGLPELGLPLRQALCQDELPEQEDLVAVQGVRPAPREVRVKALQLVELRALLAQVRRVQADQDLAPAQRGGLWAAKAHRAHNAVRVNPEGRQLPLVLCPEQDAALGGDDLRETQRRPRHVGDLVSFVGQAVGEPDRFFEHRCGRQAANWRGGPRPARPLALGGDVLGEHPPDLLRGEVLDRQAAVQSGELGQRTAAKDVLIGGAKVAVHDEPAVVNDGRVVQAPEDVRVDVLGVCQHQQVGLRLRGGAVRVDKGERESPLLRPALNASQGHPAGLPKLAIYLEILRHGLNQPHRGRGLRRREGVLDAPGIQLGQAVKGLDPASVHDGVGGQGSLPEGSEVGGQRGGRDHRQVALLGRESCHLILNARGEHQDVVRERCAVLQEDLLVLAVNLHNGGGDQPDLGQEGVLRGKRGDVRAALALRGHQRQVGELVLRVSQQRLEARQATRGGTHHQDPGVCGVLLTAKVPLVQHEEDVAALPGAPPPRDGLEDVQDVRNGLGFVQLEAKGGPAHQPHHLAQEELLLVRKDGVHNQRSELPEIVFPVLECLRERWQLKVGVEFRDLDLWAHRAHPDDLPLAGGLDERVLVQSGVDLFQHPLILRELSQQLQHLVVVPLATKLRLKVPQQRVPVHDVQDVRAELVSLTLGQGEVAEQAGDPRAVGQGGDAVVLPRE